MGIAYKCDGCNEYYDYDIQGDTQDVTDFIGKDVKISIKIVDDVFENIQKYYCKKCLKLVFLEMLSDR